MGSTKYIRRPAVFNPGSEREKRIWEWIQSSTNNFEGQNFAAFVRDKLEWCMLHEGVQYSFAGPLNQQSAPNSDVKKGYSKLL